jgi:hypothetical protein
MCFTWVIAMLVSYHIVEKQSLCFIFTLNVIFMQIILMQCLLKMYFRQLLYIFVFRPCEPSIEDVVILTDVYKWNE